MADRFNRNNRFGIPNNRLGVPAFVGDLMILNDIPYDAPESLYKQRVIKVVERVIAILRIGFLERARESLIQGHMYERVYGQFEEILGQLERTIAEYWIEYHNVNGMTDDMY